MSRLSVCKWDGPLHVMCFAMSLHLCCASQKLSVRISQDTRFWETLVPWSVLCSGFSRRDFSADPFQHFCKSLVRDCSSAGLKFGIMHISILILVMSLSYIYCSNYNIFWCLNTDPVVKTMPNYACARRKLWQKQACKNDDRVDSPHCCHTSAGQLPQTCKVMIPLAMLECQREAQRKREREREREPRYLVDRHSAIWELFVKIWKCGRNLNWKLRRLLGELSKKGPGRCCCMPRHTKCSQRISDTHWSCYRFVVLSSQSLQYLCLPDCVSVLAQF